MLTPKNRATAPSTGNATWSGCNGAQTAAYSAVKRDDTKEPTEQSKTHNLFIAFKDYFSEVLRFLCDFPFDDNWVELDIRVLKGKMKISGFFLRVETGKLSLRIRAFLPTTTKQGYSAFEGSKACLQVN